MSVRKKPEHPLFCKRYHIKRYFFLLLYFHAGALAWEAILAEGIDGLQMRPVHSRKPIMDCLDERAVRFAIEQDRQSVSKAKKAWQQATGKQAERYNIQMFLSALAQDISV